MEEMQLRVRCALTEKNYREYMLFHVFGRNRDWFFHLILVLLTLAFGLVNFRVDSPILGWVFSGLAAYLLVSRYLRFLLSLRRNIRQFGLTDEPKWFYTITFYGNEFSVESGDKSVRYPYTRIQKAYFRDMKGIAYLFLSEQQAFLLPYASFETGSAKELRLLIADRTAPGVTVDK